ncbi:MAG: serine/threonine protein kinase [Pedosphaera sp.]|nr:serine/threonine protein kinase [Pedosphaera sp.]
MRQLFSTVFVALFALSLTAAELNWPQFRGPHGDGASPAKNIPVTWSEANNLAWKVSVPGRGRSSPVVVGNRLWLTLAVEQGVVRQRINSDDMQTAEHVSLEVICLDAADGKVVWRTKLFDVDKPDPVHWFNSWATPTPVVEAGKIYCDFGTFGTTCLNAKNGKLVWKTRLPLDHQVGPGSSAVLYQNLLVLVRDGRDAQYVAALDKQTGKQVWRTERPPIEASSGNLKKSFVTPLLVNSAGRTQLISPSAHWIVSYDPATGREFWRARHGTGFSIGSCPVFGDGVAYFSTGCMKPQLCAFRVDGAGDVTTTHAVWKTLRQVPVMSSPLLQGDALFWTSDDGMANCASTKDGEAHWQERLNQQHLASPLLAEGRVYFFGKEGKTTVVKAAKQFEKLAENQLDGTVIATPAIVDGTIFLRTDTHLYRIGKK